MLMHLKRFVAGHALGCILASASCYGWVTLPAEARSVSVTETRCDAKNIVVRSSDTAEVLTLCEGAGDAIAFLASQGLDVTGEIIIALVPKLPATAGASAAGCYLESERRGFILLYSEFKKFRTWFNIRIDRSLYRSLVSHEVAHAVAVTNFKVPTPSIQAKEYVAYVTMFSTMSRAQRDRVLSQFDGEAFEGDWQMGTTIYMLDPIRFGILAYRHFLKAGNGRDYLHAILAGKALAE